MLPAMTPMSQCNLHTQRQTALLPACNSQFRSHKPLKPGKALVKMSSHETKALSKLFKSRRGVESSRKPCSRGGSQVLHTPSIANIWSASNIMSTAVLTIQQGPCIQNMLLLPAAAEGHRRTLHRDSRS